MLRSQNANFPYPSPIHRFIFNPLVDSGLLKPDKFTQLYMRDKANMYAVKSIKKGPGKPAL